jgi:uncharacterized protein YjbI with pentapeptide repeats
MCIINTIGRHAMDEQQQNARRSLKRPSLGKNEQTSVEEKDHRALLQLVRPTTDDRTAWGVYWQEQNQPWRTEPEISPRRQAELEKRRALVPDVKKGIYPFKGMKLDRADVEWLLATYAGGPVKWSDEKEREREGLDVRGADLQHVNLHRLPLTRLRGGLTFDEWLKATEEQRSSAVVLMRGANLSYAQLEGANLSGAQLEGAYLSYAQLEEANFIGAQLKEVDLKGTQLKGAYLYWAQLEGAYLSEAQLEGADLREAQLKGVDLSYAQLRGADLSYAQLEEANFIRAQLKGVDLVGAQLKGADLREAQLEEANFIGAQLKGADLGGAQLDGAYLREAQLEGVNLSGAQLKGADLRNVILGDKQRIGPRLADLQWGDTNLAAVDWSQVAALGDEHQARQKKTPDGKKKEQAARLSEYQAAVRANRQLAVALQAQGLSEEAARFAYRAQRLQRIVLRRQRKLVVYLFSGVLDLLAGYGYRPGRSVIAYLVIIVGFMGLYLLNAHFAAPHLRWDEALVLSVSSFHGRGFFSQEISLGDTYARLAAAEAVVGLLIEISFIATFTQRFFGK